jgi:hypothetical protein
MTPRKTAVKPWMVRVPPPISDTPEPSRAVDRTPAIEDRTEHRMK